eukprot:1955798-Amphidinium_carterae.2
MARLRAYKFSRFFRLVWLWHRRVGNSELLADAEQPPLPVRNCLVDAVPLALITLEAAVQVLLAQSMAGRADDARLVLAARDSRTAMH